MQQSGGYRGHFKGRVFHFRLHGVDYYPNLAPDAVPRLLNMGYDYLILDLGSLNESAAAEFLRCDRKIVLGSLALWKAWSYEEFSNNLTALQTLGKVIIIWYRWEHSRIIPFFQAALHIHAGGSVHQKPFSYREGALSIF